MPSLAFARDAQIYLLALMSGRIAPVDPTRRARDGFASYAGGIDRALSPDREFLVGSDVTLRGHLLRRRNESLLQRKARVDVRRTHDLDPILHAKIDAESRGLCVSRATAASIRPSLPRSTPYLAKLEGR